MAFAFRIKLSQIRQSPQQQTAASPEVARMTRIWVAKAD